MNFAIGISKWQSPGSTAKTKSLRITQSQVLKTVLINALKLLHPFMPFITEEIYTELLKESESIMISDYPVYDEKLAFAKEEGYMNSVMNLIRSVRNQRTEMNVPPSKKAQLIIRTDKTEEITSCEAYIKKLAYASNVTVISPCEEEPKNAVSCVCDIGEAYMPLGELIDTAKERERLLKEKENLLGEIKQCQRQAFK